MTVDPRLGSLVAEMAAASQALHDATEPTERLQLCERLRSLRSEAAALRGPKIANLSDPALNRVIARCERDLEAFRSGRLDSSMVGGASGLGGGLDPIATAHHNRAVDEHGGRALLESELTMLLAEQDRRRG